jgi:hypothetical protein
MEIVKDHHAVDLNLCCWPNLFTARTQEIEAGSETAYLSSSSPPRVFSPFLTCGKGPSSLGKGSLGVKYTISDGHTCYVLHAGNRQSAIVTPILIT